MTELQAVRRAQKRLSVDSIDDAGPLPKRKKRECNCEGARACVYRDCLGDDPYFGDQFERIFRITKPIFHRIMDAVSSADPFFGFRPNPVKKKGIYPEAKVMIALKQLACGCAPTAFLDCYFQMGETTGRECLKKFCQAIVHSNLKQRCLQKMTREDAKRVSQLHEDEFTVPGVMGCLDCVHVYWRTCPMAWQGQCKGKEDHASLVLEAVADYNTWFWHQCFGPPGTLNDINVWDRSPLLRSFLNGDMDGVDFDFQIDEKAFNQVHYLVDGIYPELGRFCKTISIPLGNKQIKYSKWQEGSRKAVERAFGILQRKFQTLKRPVDLFFEEDIKDVVETCLILHNMMVENRMERDENSERHQLCDMYPLDECELNERRNQTQGMEASVSTATSGSSSERDRTELGRLNLVAS